MPEKEPVINISHESGEFDRLSEIAHEDGIATVADLYKNAIEFYLQAREVRVRSFDIVGRDVEGEVLGFSEILGSYYAGIENGEEVPWNLTFLENKKKGDKGT